MKQYITSCDMGSIKIFTEDMATFFGNDFGDGANLVKVLDKTESKKYMNNGADQGKFLEHFTIRTHGWLSTYDCDNSPCHEFTPGRYFVYLEKPKEKDLKKQGIVAVFVIAYCDDNLEA